MSSIYPSEMYKNLQIADPSYISTQYLVKYGLFIEMTFHMQIPAFWNDEPTWRAAK